MYIIIIGFCWFLVLLERGQIFNSFLLKQSISPPPARLPRFSSTLSTLQRFPLFLLLSLPLSGSVGINAICFCGSFIEFGYWLFFECPLFNSVIIMSSATATITDAESGKRKASSAGLSAHNCPVKRRASKACCCCRARKVRCDVVENGSPCTNCRLDQVECIVTESKRRKFVEHVIMTCFVQKA